MRLHFREHGRQFALVVASIGQAPSALWEIFEWGIGIMKNPGSDPLMDLFGALLGGAAATWVLHRESPAEAHGAASH